MSLTKKTFVIRKEREKTDEIIDIVVREFPLTIFLNGMEVATLLCSPKSLDYLAFGFLFSEGLIKQNIDIKSTQIEKEEDKASVKINTKYEFNIEDFEKKGLIKASSGGAILSNKTSLDQYKPGEIKIHYETVFSLIKAFATMSKVFKDTGGVHGAALSDGKELIIFHEDIGRHNALDKVIGEALIKGIDLRNKILLTSGRVSSEMLLKAANINAPIFISHAAPMDFALNIGREINMTIIGFARGERFNLYSGKERIIL